jgi:ADP-heptose:LPS heptosyltransferase
LRNNTFSGHLAEQYLQALTPLNVSNYGKGLEYFISEKEETKKQDIPASHHAGFIACVIADEGKKQWQLDNWKEFCSAMDHPLILLGDKKDSNRAEEIKAFDPVKIYSACGKFSINEMADLVNKAKVVLTPGSWLMQVAAAYKRPVVWLHDGVLPPAVTGPYYGDNFLNARNKPPFIQCKVSDDVKSITKNILSYL